MDAELDARARANFTRMLHARRVAVIGASERNPFSAPVIANLANQGFTGEVLLVNPKGDPVHGRPTLRRAAELDGPIDAAFICVPQASVIETVAEAADAGATGFVVVNSGFAETGADGAALQRELASVARSRSAALLGPNSLGFINNVAGVPLIVLERQMSLGTMGIVSVSGSVGAYIMKVAQLQGVGVSHVVLTGNEAGVTIADALEFMIDDPHTRVVALFMEGMHDPDRFVAVAERALAARKPIVVLKPGRAEATASLVAAHTGTLLGDDRVFDAVAAELGLSRVDSYEDLVATAALLQAVGPVSRPGVAAMTVSGGSGEILSDLADGAGVAMPPFAEPARTLLQQNVSAFGQTHNPLDLTGAALADPGLWERCLGAMAQDEGIGLALCLWDPPLAATSDWMGATLHAISRGYAAYPSAPPLIAPVAEPVTDEGLELVRAAGLPGVICGLKPAVTGLARLRSWSERALDPRPVSIGRGNDAPPAGLPRPPHEHALLERLRELGAPVLAQVLAGTEEEAVAAARAAGWPVAMKVVAPGLAHKSEVGGVRLGLGDEAGVRVAFAELMAIPCAAPVAGVAIAPMRRIAAELLVAFTRDREWGPMLTLGLGGIWVEALDDVATLPWPAEPDRIVSALLGLRGSRLLTGARGRPALDLDSIADAILRIAAAAAALGPELQLLEINPLAISSAGPEALDAWAVWQD